MTVWQLILHEIKYRKLSLVLGLCSVTIAVASLVGALTLLRAHDLRTERIIKHKAAQIQQEMARLEDDYRKIMKKLGYNVLILRKDQDLAELHAKGYATRYMPEGYALRLATGNIVTLNHLLPVLQQKVTWPEQQREILLAGIRGQVSAGHRPEETKAPIMRPVPQGGMTIGHALAQSLRLTEGQTVRLMGENFTINAVLPRKGNQDDTTAWINLDRAQALLRKPGQINGILALECVCLPDALGKISAEVTRILPDTQVYEFSSLASTRTEARLRAKEAGEQAIAQEKAHRAALRREREDLTAVMAPLVIAGCALWILLLVYGNVRERRSEVGILRAIGVRPRQILWVFIGKAMLMGLGGALLGYALGLVIGAVWGGVSSTDFGIARLFSPLLFVGVLALAPLLAGVASWLPALLAAEQDPASVLREE